MRRGHGAVAVLAGLVLAAGSARAAAPALDPTWRRLRSEHFVLTTDHGEAEARTAIGSLEATRAELLLGLWGTPTLAANVRTHVLVLARDTDYERYFGRTVIGLATSMGGTPVLVLYGMPDRWARGSATRGTNTSVLKHELTHQLAASIYRREPRWFSEGLAQFAETITPSDDRKMAVLGRPNMEAYEKYNRARSVGVADLFTWTSDANLDEMSVHGRYGLAWATVHWLYNAHPDGFLAYQQALQQGRDPAVAWSTAVSGMAPGDVDRAINQYLKHGDYQEFNVPLPPPAPVSVVAEPVTVADGWVVRAELSLAASRWSQKPELAAESAEQFKKAIAADPGNPRALAEAPGLDREQRLAGARVAVVAHPDDPLAWTLLADNLPSDAGTERETAYRKAVALGSDARAMNNLAWQLVQTGHAQEAVGLAQSAVRLEPGMPPYLDTFAAALAATGRCADAVVAQRKALEVLPDGVPEATRADYTARVKTRESGCTPAGAVTAAPPSAPAAPPPPRKPATRTKR